MCIITVKQAAVYIWLNTIYNHILLNIYYCTVPITNVSQMKILCQDALVKLEEINSLQQTDIYIETLYNIQLI